jgi:hypothetical protein
MQEALLSHMKAVRWILVRLNHLGTEPEIQAVRANADEVVVVTRYVVLHEPKDLATLCGLYEEARTKVKGATEASERLRKTILEGMS